MKNESKERSVSTASALLVLAVFAVGILSVLLGGAQVYRRLTVRDQQAYERRTCAQYLTVKLRQASGTDAVSVLPFGDGDGLMIACQEPDGIYLTRIYCHDGWLMELYTDSQGSFAPEDGEKILKASRMELTYREGLLTACVTDQNGGALRLVLSVRGTEVLS